MITDELRAEAAEDLRCHRANGVDLNPFSPDGSRYLWAQGFRGNPLPNGYPETCHAARYYFRGAAARELIAAESQSPTTTADR